MYIISKHKDYYDGVINTMGVDKTIIYDRKLYEISDYEKFPDEFQRKRFDNYRKINHFLNLENYPLKKSVKYFNLNSFIIGFCGKLYIGWKFYEERKNIKDQYGMNKIYTKIIYDYDDAKKYIQTTNWGGNLNDSVNYVLNYDPIEIFRKYNTPVFVYVNESMISVKDVKFIINPILKDYEFYKIFDSFTAFQEIQMFISGVLGSGENKMIEIEDRYKIPQHGYDKWSFRREPSKRK